MDPTSVSLLARIRTGPNPESWERFVRLYAPLLVHWARQLGLQEQDADDLVQDVLVTLVQKLPDFQYQPGRSFRGWMRTLLVNKWRDRPRRGATIALDQSGVHPPAPPDGDGFEEREYRRHLAAQALRLMKAEFQPATWQACWETVVCGRSTKDVAVELGITANAVYLAKARVLARLRAKLVGMLD